MSFQIKGLQEKRAKLAAESKALLDKIEKEDRQITAEEQAQFEAIQKDVAVYDARLKNLKAQYELEQSVSEVQNYEALKGSTLSATETDMDALASDQYSKAFDRYLRYGERSSILEQYAIEKGSDIVGPQSYYNGIISALKHYAGVLEAGATVITTQTGTSLPMYCLDDTANVGELLSEAGPTTGADASKAEKVLNAYIYSSKDMVFSRSLVEDNGFNLESAITNLAATRIGRKLNLDFTSANGSNKPEGFITGGTSNGGNEELTYENLILLEHSLDASYRKESSCAWQMNDATLANVRLLTDGNGRYIWTPGAAGQPDRISGKPIVVNNDMTDGMFAIGAWSHYKVRFVRGVEVQRLAGDEFARKFQVAYIGFLRADGHLATAGAVKYQELYFPS